MSSEYTPDFDKLTQNGTGFVNGDRLDLRASDLDPVDVVRARADIKAAIQSSEHRTLERPITAQEELSKRGSILIRFRRAYQENNFDLSKDGDEEVKTTMFSQPALRDENTFDLTSDDLNPDMFTPPKPDVAGHSRDDYGKAA